MKATNALSSEGRSFLRDAAAVLGSRTVVLVLGFLSGVVVARLLGPSGKGALATVMVYVSMVTTLVGMGVRQAAVHAVGRQPEARQRVIQAVVGLFLPVGILGAVLVAGSLTLLDNPALTIATLCLAALLVLSQVLTSYVSGIYLGLGDVRRFNTLAWLPPAITFLGVLIFVFWASFGIDGALAASALGALATALFSLLSLSKSWSIRPRLDIQLSKQLIRRGVVYAASLFVLTLNYRIDIVLLERLSTLGDVGQYSVAVSLAELIWQVPAAAGLIVFSRSARSVDPEGFSRDLMGILRSTLLFGSACAFAMAILSPYFIRFVYGAPFGKSATTVALLLPGIVLLLVHKILNMDLAGRGRPGAALLSFLPAVVLNVVLNILWIPRYGLYGAAVASTLSYALASVLLARQYLTITGLPASELYRFEKNDFVRISNVLRRVAARVSGRKTP